MEPGEEALYLPAALVSTERAEILGKALAIRSIGRNQLDPPLRREPRVERVAVVGLVADKALGELGEEAAIEGSFDERDFMRRSTFDADGERKTRAVCNGHDFGPLATLRFSDAAPPFLALTNVPSMNASLKLICPRSRKSPAKAYRIRSSVPSLDHCWNRRWHVW